METFNDHRREGWSRAGSQEEAGKFNLWEKRGRFPTHSLPALEAAKCMEEQGEELFEQYHFLLLKSFFEENRDISDREILLELAGKTGADLKAFAAAFTSGSARGKVLAEHRLATERYWVNAVPSVVIEGENRLIGAVPRQAYRDAIQQLINRRDR